jgi:hypothetical protein
MSVTAKALIQAKFASSTQTTEYTAGTLHTIIDKFTITNTDATAKTISINIVASGGSVATSNKIVSSLSIAAGVTYVSSEMANQVLNNGDFISVIASAASLVVIRASGREIA